MSATLTRRGPEHGTSLVLDLRDGLEVYRARAGRTDQAIFDHLHNTAYTSRARRWMPSSGRSEVVRKHRRLALALSVIVVGGVIWNCWPMIWPEGGISPDSYARIRLGMTQGEAERIIGLPPGSYSSLKYTSGACGHVVEREGIHDADPPQSESAVTQDRQGWVTVKRWWGTWWAIHVAVDGEGVVVGKYLLRLSR